MNGTILNLRHEITPKEAKRRGLPTNFMPERWEVKEGEDVIMIWIDENGFHSVRNTKDSNEKITEHPSNLTWVEFLDKVEKQLRLF